ncbi:putative monovalent cation/H+ antiporter subunit F [Rickettsiales bacterium Ac37b]|nr:putative monovalent cation/H+ antiporter subunit F [Rickettsiales bacterium Ac37b]
MYNIFYVIITLLILTSITLMLISIFNNSSIFDKIMSMNCLTNYVIILITLIASLKVQETFLDIALIYAFINFIATIGFLRYFKQKQLKE